MKNCWNLLHLFQLVNFQPVQTVFNNFRQFLSRENNSWNQLNNCKKIIPDLLNETVDLEFN